jgi:predicted lipoprotein with Yx(FWY)xxD motif
MHVLRSLSVLFVLNAAACGTHDGDLKPSAGDGAPVSIGTLTTAQFGVILVGTDGLSLYTRAGDSASISTCTDSCITAWPPLTVPKGQQAVGGPGVNGTFGTLARPDGTLQATYADHPLYYSQGDTSAGDVTGEGIDGFSVASP